jgi:hypothetical protein
VIIKQGSRFWVIAKSENRDRFAQEKTPSQTFLTSCQFMIAHAAGRIALTDMKHRGILIVGLSAQVHR